MRERAIRLVVRDPDLERSRLTVGFRLILAIPHLIWLAGWFSLAVMPVSVANWIATLIQGKPSPMFHRFLSSYVRYTVHVVSYVTLAADPYPGFAGRAGSYPIDVEIDPLTQQNRWVTGFRLILALPAIYRAPVMLRDIQGMSTEEASAMLHVKDQTLKSRLHRGRLILRRQLADFAGGLTLHRPIYGT